MRPSPQPPSRRTVIVVGASSGIGRATAHQLATRSDHLVLCSRGEAALVTTAQECEAAGAASVTVETLDVRDRLAVDGIVAHTVERRGTVDAVIHTAGVVAYGRFEEIPAEIFDAVVNTNLYGAANVARSVLPVFRRQRRGTLVLTGSVIGNIAAPTMTPYAVSKYAVRSLGRQLALENRDLPNLHVTVVSPGSVDTPIYRQAASFSARAARPPAPVDSARKVAAAIVKAVDRPRDRVSVGLANTLMRAGFTLTPHVFDALVGPIFTLAASKPGRQPTTTGNVLEARPDAEGVSGGEGQGLHDLLGRIRGR